MKPLSISLRSLDVLAEPPMRTRLRVAAASWRRVAVCLIACYSLGLWFATLSVGAEPAIPALTGQETIRVKSGDNSYVGRSMFEGYSGLTLLNVLGARRDQ